MHIQGSKDIEALKEKCLEKFPDGLPSDYLTPRKEKRKPTTRWGSRNSGRTANYMPYGSSNAPHPSHFNNQSWQSQYQYSASPSQMNILNFDDHAQYPNPPPERQSRREERAQSQS